MSEDQFLKDVSGHKMTAVFDNGINRCLRFAAEGQYSWNQHFTLTTWPGYLCISGDMGCFVFTRLEDMFEFFRSAPRENKGLYINTGYWAEKCEAQDRRSGGVEAFSEDLFRNAIGRRFGEYFEEAATRAEKKRKQECWEEIKEHVLCYADNEYDAMRAASGFEHDGFSFSDFWETRVSDYTPRFVWCCYAIAWGIRQYDLSKELAEVSDERASG